MPPWSGRQSRGTDESKKCLNPEDSRRGVSPACSSWRVVRGGGAAHVHSLRRGSLPSSGRKESLETKRHSKLLFLRTAWVQKKAEKRSRIASPYFSKILIYEFTYLVIFICTLKMNTPCPFLCSREKWRELKDEWLVCVLHPRSNKATLCILSSAQTARTSFLRVW